MTECYFCTRDLRNGHWPLCPVLDMSKARRQTFFGVLAALKHEVLGEDTSPGNSRATPMRGYLMGDSLV